MTSITQTDAKTESKTVTFNPTLVLLLALSAASFAGIFMRAAQNTGMPSPVIATGRMLLAGIFLTPIVLTKYRDDLKKLSRRDLMLGLLGGVALAAHFMALVFALENTTLMLLTVILNTAPLWTGLLETAFLKARINRVMWMGLFITIAGSVFIGVMSQGDANEMSENVILGIILALITSILYAVYMTIGRSVRAKVSMIPYVWIVFGFGGIIGLIFTLAIGIPITGHAEMGYFWLLLLTLIPQLIGHSGMNYAVGYFSATFLSIANQSLTISVAILAFLIFAEVPTPANIIGAIITLSGVMLAIYGRTKQKPESPT